MDKISYIPELLKPILTYPQDLFVEEKIDANGIVSILIHVSSVDMKKLVGNKGVIFKALKSILAASYKDSRLELVINIIN